METLKRFTLNWFWCKWRLVSSEIHVWAITKNKWVVCIVRITAWMGKQKSAIRNRRNQRAIKKKLISDESKKTSNQKGSHPEQSANDLWVILINKPINNDNNNYYIIIQFIYSWLEKIANANKGQLYLIYNI